MPAWQDVGLLKSWLLRAAARLPATWQFELKRLRYTQQIASGKFRSPEPEIALLPQLLRAGDWAIDVGANVGHYVKAMSDIAGAEGRVVALEPMPTTFALLAANMQRLKHKNVTLINAAASSHSGVVSMAIPTWSNGTENPYQARISDTALNVQRVAALRLDCLELANRISVVKIDAEGHEGAALLGMQGLLARDRPVLIMEVGGRESADLLASLGYRLERLDGSSNVVAYPG